ncbi:MAG: hypothetical protein HQ509_04685 [Candidatus Marinimicrobia bacterium]|nr:hypothetical protein [Candidatus Neomarinimicrobiota bacterium]
MKYFVFVLFIGISFCQDTLKIKPAGLVYFGQFQGIQDTKIKFKTDGAYFMIEISRIEYLSTSDTIIIKDGELLVPQDMIGTYNSPSVDVKFKPGTLTKAGGICIAAAGALGYSNMISEFDGDSIDEDFKPTTEFENYNDTIKNKAKVMYVLLVIGGVLIAVDQ